MIPGGYDRTLRMFGARCVRVQKKITHADLVAAATGGAQDVLLVDLPPSSTSFVLATVLKVNAFFGGGGATAVTCAIGTGTAGDPDSIMQALNVFGATANGIWLPGVPGVAPSGPRGGAAVYATFAPDAGHTLLALTAGDVEIEMLVSVEPDRQTGF